MADPAGLAVGVDVGGTKILGVVADVEAQVVCEVRRPAFQGTSSDGGQQVADDIAELTDELHRACGLEVGSVPIGVGLPGMVDRSGSLIYAPNLQSATGSPMEALLGDRFGDAVFILANDADCAAVAEHRAGSGRGHDDLIMITLGTGIGGGIIQSGSLLRGGRGFAGEIGHMVVDIDGPACPCGARGCWERYASGTAVDRMAREASARGELKTVTEQMASASLPLSGEAVTMAALGGDVESMAILDAVGWWLARGIANLVCVLDPTCIVLGGGLSSIVELILPVVHSTLPTMLEGGALHPGIEVLAAHFGESAGAIGASFLARSNR